MKDRSKLPFRKNCEGYLILGDSLVARNTEYGYIDFPGGGVDDGEALMDALKREAFEEAGVILEDGLKEVGVLKTIWPSDWAKNEKQIKRFEKYRGDEMHFFIGKVKKLVDPRGDENENGEKNNGKWDNDERLMKITNAIKIIEGYKPFVPELKEYYEFKLKILNGLSKDKRKGDVE
jgi:8-oxo-dGTP pyrophosphatase MutT (NUDIX family)